MLLLTSVYQLIEPMPVKPLVTLSLLALNVYVFMYYYSPIPILGFYDLGNVNRHCLNPKVILEEAMAWAAATLPLGANGISNPWIWQSISWGYKKVPFPWNRLVLSAFIHADERHLYYNMASFAYKGVLLEERLGVFRYAILVVWSIVVAPLLTTLISYAVHEHSQLPNSFNTCTVGFSAVVFSLKYVVNAQAGADERTSIRGFIMQTRHVAWAELVLIYLIEPRSSFVGHISGILAGMLWVYAPGIVPKRWQESGRWRSYL